MPSIKLAPAAVNGLFSNACIDTTSENSFFNARLRSVALNGSMRTYNHVSYLYRICLLEEKFMYPKPPNSITGCDLGSNEKEFVNLPIEVTCKSRQGISGSSERALLLKNNGCNVCVVFALNDEPYDVLMRHVVKMSWADIPVRIVAGAEAKRKVGRENGTVILKKVLTMLHNKVLSGEYDSQFIKKIKFKFKICYYDGSSLQVIMDKIRLAEEFKCCIDEISIQLQPLEDLEGCFKNISKFLKKIGKNSISIVCYAVIFASQQAYSQAPDRIRKMAGHGFYDQDVFLKRLKATIDEYDDVSIRIRLSFFGFSGVNLLKKIDVLKKSYAALR